MVEWGDEKPSYRVATIAATRDVPLTKRLRREWVVNMPLAEREWKIGLIVGPSGSGKSVIARTLWPDAYRNGYEWHGASLLDDFPKTERIQDIADALISVGFSTPPDWVKPYAVLSTGQQMRANLARAVLDPSELSVFDEFTSVVDRTTAQIGSAALAHAVRKHPTKRFIAVTCHEDVEQWLTPDWTYDPHVQRFDWRLLRCRPSITLQVGRVQTSIWRIFGQYHYLAANLNPSAVCYAAFLGDDPVAFVAVLPMIGFAGVKRLHRVVVLPDYQGVGIGGAVSDAVCQSYIDRGKRIRVTSAQIGLVSHRLRSKKWRLVDDRPTGFREHGGSVRTKVSTGRHVYTFEYVGIVSE